MYSILAKYYVRKTDKEITQQAPPRENKRNAKNCAVQTVFHHVLQKKPPNIYIINNQAQQEDEFDIDQYLKNLTTFDETTYIHNNTESNRSLSRLKIATWDCRGGSLKDFRCM